MRDLGCLIRQDPWSHGNCSLVSNINLCTISGPQVRSLGVDQKEAREQSRRRPSEQEGPRPQLLPAPLCCWRCAIGACYSASIGCSVPWEGERHSGACREGVRRRCEVVGWRRAASGKGATELILWELERWWTAWFVGRLGPEVGGCWCWWRCALASGWSITVFWLGSSWFNYFKDEYVAS